MNNENQRGVGSGSNKLSEGMRVRGDSDDHVADSFLACNFREKSWKCPVLCGTVTLASKGYKNKKEIAIFG